MLIENFRDFQEHAKVNPMLLPRTRQKIIRCKDFNEVVAVNPSDNDALKAIHFENTMLDLLTAGYEQFIEFVPDNWWDNITDHSKYDLVKFDPMYYDFFDKSKLKDSYSELTEFAHKKSQYYIKFLIEKYNKA